MHYAKQPLLCFEKQFRQEQRAKSAPLAQAGNLSGRLSRVMASHLSWSAMDLPYLGFIIHFCYIAVAQLTSPLA